MTIHDRLTERRDSALSRCYQSSGVHHVPTTSRQRKKTPVENPPAPKVFIVFALMLAELAVLYGSMGEASLAELSSGSGLNLMK